MYHENLADKNCIAAFGNDTVLLGWACTEMYDFERLSGMIPYDPEVDAPLVRGSLTAEDLFASMGFADGK